MEPKLFVATSSDHYRRPGPSVVRHRLLLRLRMPEPIKLALTILCIIGVVAAACGCAAIPRKTTLTEVSSGDVCYGGFNLVTRAGWVVLPEGTKLTGKIVGVTDQQSTRG